VQNVKGLLQAVALLHEGPRPAFFLLQKRLQLKLVLRESIVFRRQGDDRLLHVCELSRMALCLSRGGAGAHTQSALMIRQHLTQFTALLLVLSCRLFSFGLRILGSK